MPDVSMQWRAALSGDLHKLDDLHAKAVTGAIRGAVNRLKNQGRRQMERAGLGKRLPRALRGIVVSSTGTDITRRGVDANPTGTVFSKAIVKGTNGVVDLIQVFEEGATVQARGGRYTAIPTKAAGGRHAAPMDAYPKGTFRVFPIRGNRGRLRRGGVRAAFVAVHHQTNVVWYILVPAFTLRRRLKLGEAYERIAAGVPNDIDRRYARALVRVGAV